MIDKFKEWWNRNEIPEKLAVASIATVLFTIMYGIVWGMDSIISWGVNITGLAWFIRGWTIGSFAYVAVAAWEEWKDYRLIKAAEEEEDEHSLL